MTTFTIADMLEILAALKKNSEPSSSNSSGQTCSFKVGECYLIRTVTMTQTGRVVAITDSDIMLEDAAWIADTGRFYNALKTGSLEEVEPFPNGCGVSRAAIVDFAPWVHALPMVQK